jgi:hypothetical protein
VIQEQPTPPQTPQPPREKPLTPAEIRKAHFDAISGLLDRNENEFRELVKNQNTPADAISNSLTAIHALRIEKEHNRP